MASARLHSPTEAELLVLKKRESGTEKKRVKYGPLYNSKLDNYTCGEQWVAQVQIPLNQKLPPALGQLTSQELQHNLRKGQPLRWTIVALVKRSQW